MGRSMSILPFNNKIDSGLRVLCLLHFCYPLSFGIQELVLLDYLTLHTGDFTNELKSLHPAVPYRSGEILVRVKFCLKELNSLLN